MNFFKKTHNNETLDEEVVDLEADVSQSQLLTETSVDLNQHLLIDFERAYTRYTRFNSRSVDENLDFEDTISVLIPPKPQTTNVLLFQLILLESENIPKDYTVGWGVFPLLN